MFKGFSEDQIHEAASSLLTADEFEAFLQNEVAGSNKALKRILGRQVELQRHRWRGREARVYLDCACGNRLPALGYEVFANPHIGLMGGFVEIVDAEQRMIDELLDATGDLQ